MSYARFSSDAFQSDVYVYQSDQGWVTWVARVHVNIDTSKIPEHDWNDSEKVVAYYQAVSREHARCMDEEDVTPLPPIPGHDPEFPHVASSPGECADFLERLKGLGYYIPDRTIPALRAEQEELDEGPGRKSDH